MGSATSTTRTAEQTEIALFFGGNLTAQLRAGYRDHISRHHLDAGEAAFYLVVGNLAQSDAVISSWNANLNYSFWRPVTALGLAGTDRKRRHHRRPRLDVAAARTAVPVLRQRSHRRHGCGHQSAEHARGRKQP